MAEEIDLVIIGGGPAGLTAGLYAARARLGCAILEKMIPGGLAATTHLIENYPGFPEGIGGMELALKIEEQARRFGARVEIEEVERVGLVDGGFEVKTNLGEWRSRGIIVASGGRPRRLGVPGEELFVGRGVSYCATCDGAFFRDRVVAVIGGGDSALEEALFLTRFAKKVRVIHRRGELRATKLLQERARGNDRIELVLNSVVEEIHGEGTVKGVTVRDVGTNERRELQVDGLFVYVGFGPNTEFLPPEVRTDEAGFVLTNERLETSVPGMFAAGDVRVKSVRQVATAVGDGALAAVNAGQYIESLANHRG